MSSIESIKTNLHLFVEKTEKLNNLSFTKIIRENKMGATICSIRRDDGLFDVTSERRGPNEELIDAFLFTFRLFLQNKESWSIGNLERFYSSEFLGGDFLKEYRDIRLALNHYLDNAGDFIIKDNDRVLSRLDIMEVFLYGDLAHTNNVKKRKLFLSWTSEQSSHDLLMSVFVVIVSRVLMAINGLKDLNSRALLELQKIDYDKTEKTPECKY